MQGFETLRQSDVRHVLLKLLKGFYPYIFCQYHCSTWADLVSSVPQGFLIFMSMTYPMLLAVLSYCLRIILRFSDV